MFASIVVANIKLFLKVDGFSELAQQLFAYQCKGTVRVLSLFSHYGSQFPADSSV
jgi:hypothetical protein